MRARYYSPDMRRFINADIVAGTITNAVTLNRYAYANANPAMNIDPLGLSGWDWLKKAGSAVGNFFKDTGEALSNAVEWVVDKVVVKPIETGKKVVDYIAMDLGEDIVEHIVEPVIEFGKKATDYIATDLGEDIVEYVAKPISDFIGNSISFIGDMKDVVINNIDASAGISIGIGFSQKINGVGVEAISRMDIVGIQLNDGELKTGHIGRSALAVGIGSVTVGPQSDTYEDFGINTREVSNPYYYNVGRSGGQAAAFVIGYHYDYSVSFSGMKDDFLNVVEKYFK